MSVGFFYNYKKRDVLSGEKLLYHGTWNNQAPVAGSLNLAIALGEQVSFERYFRGHLFTLDECQALCNGEMIHVYGLSRGNSSYGVFGGLTLRGKKQLQEDGSILLRFEPFDVTVDVSDYDFSNREIVYLGDYIVGSKKESESESPTGFMSHGLPGVASVAGSVLDEFSDTEDAKLSARIAQTDLPQVKETSYVVHNNVRVFVPVYPGVPGYDPNYEEFWAQIPEEESDAFDNEFVLSDEFDSEDVEVVGGFSIDMSTGMTEQLSVQESEPESDHTVKVVSEFDSVDQDDFADLEYADEEEYLDDPLADPEYDPEEAELETDYEED